MGSRPATALLWMRFGPYHLARLRAASELFAHRGWKVAGLEVAERDVYGWDVQSGSGDFDRLTLFPGREYGNLLDWEIAGAVRAALEHLDPGAVGINGWAVPEARAALKWCRAKGRKAILFSETLEPEGRSRRWWKESLKSRLVRRFDAALVGGREHRRYVASLGMAEDRIHLGYDAIDNAYFRRRSDAVRAKSSELRRKHSLPDQFFYANTRFLKRKNLDGLLQGYSRYRSEAEKPPWGLVISGSGEEEPALRKICSELRLGKAVQWPGFVQYEQLPVYYGLATAFVHAARTEPWGLVLNEAAASGLPILSSSRVGAAGELVRDGQNGRLFDPDSAEEIAAALRGMARLGDQERQAMGRASREIVSHWGPGRFAQGLQECLVSCCLVDKSQDTEGNPDMEAARA